MRFVAFSAVGVFLFCVILLVVVTNSNTAYVSLRNEFHFEILKDLFYHEAMEGAWSAQNIEVFIFYSATCMMVWSLWLVVNIAKWNINIERSLAIRATPVALIGSLASAGLIFLDIKISSKRNLISLDSGYLVSSVGVLIYMSIMFVSLLFFILCLRESIFYIFRKR